MYDRYSWHSINSKVKPKENSTVEIEYVGTDGNSYIINAVYSTGIIAKEKCFYVSGANLLDNYHFVPIDGQYEGVKRWKYPR